MPRVRTRGVPGRNCLLGIAIAACLAACGDARYGTGELPDYARNYYLAAEAKWGEARIMYVYPAEEYDRIKASLTSALRTEFKSVEAKEYDSKRYHVTTDTALFEKKTQHKKQCRCGVERYSERIPFTTVVADCKVMSYWTKWNKPPTHSPFEFIFWDNDWHDDIQATIVESIKLEEALRQNLGYEFREVGRLDSMLVDGVVVDGKVIERTVLRPVPPWCGRTDAAKRFLECRASRQPPK